MTFRRDFTGLGASGPLGSDKQAAGDFWESGDEAHLLEPENWREQGKAGQGWVLRQTQTQVREPG